MKITNKCRHRDYLRKKKEKRKKKHNPQKNKKKQDNVTSFPRVRQGLGRNLPKRTSSSEAELAENAMILLQTSSTPSVLPAVDIVNVNDDDVTEADEAAVNTAGGCQKILRRPARRRSNQ